MNKNIENLINRDNEADKLIDILENKVNYKINLEIKSFNVCLNAKWGDGKTTFIEKFLMPKIMEKKMFCTKENWNIYTIDAWEHDYLNDPLELIWDFLTSNENFMKKLENLVINFSTEFLKNFKIAKSITNVISENSRSKEIQRIRTIKELGNKLAELFDSKTLIIIENIDRCNPEFSRKLIELTKHIFNNENLIVIYVADWINWNKTIMNSLHLNISSEHKEQEFYLKKVFDFVFDLEHLSRNEYLWNVHVRPILLTKNICFRFLEKDWTIQMNQGNIRSEPLDKEMKHLYFNASENMNWFFSFLNHSSFREVENTMIYIKTYFKNLFEHNNNLKQLVELDEYIMSNFLKLINTKNIFYKLKNKIDTLEINDFGLLFKYLYIFFGNLYNFYEANNKLKNDIYRNELNSIDFLISVFDSESKNIESKDSDFYKFFSEYNDQIFEVLEKYTLVLFNT